MGLSGFSPDHALLRMLPAVGFNAPERARGLGLADSRDIEVSEVASGGSGGAGEGRGDVGVMWGVILYRNVLSLGMYRLT